MATGAAVEGTHLSPPPPHLRASTAGSGGSSTTGCCRLIGAAASRPCRLARGALHSLCLLAPPRRRQPSSSR
eukprot:3653132-Prymnesium_polylepis.1